MWGSIAKQLGGDKVEVTNVISNPNADPHDYEPTVVDARNIATADMIVCNGAGYDPWVQKLVSASSNQGAAEVNAGTIAGVSAGSNPHLWYSPPVVESVARRITQTYQDLDPENEDYYRQQWEQFDTKGLEKYHQLISEIASTYAGTPIGASESIALPLATALGLEVITPESFVNAVSHGTDPTAADKVLADKQVRRKEIKVFVYNKQNSSPDVMALVAEAKAADIPVVTVTETPVPPSATFQAWQVAQLERLRSALHKATGK
jgi:zinc/manganese transport system substrate-binding protein